MRKKVPYFFLIIFFLLSVGRIYSQQEKRSSIILDKRLPIYLDLRASNNKDSIESAIIMALSERKYKLVKKDDFDRLIKEEYKRRMDGIKDSKDVKKSVSQGRNVVQVLLVEVYINQAQNSDRLIDSLVWTINPLPSPKEKIQKQVLTSPQHVSELIPVFITSITSQNKVK